MAKKRAAIDATEPRFPYTTAPGSLRKFLSLVPQKPKPQRFNPELYKSWGIGDSNANTITRVLKALELVSPSNEPTTDYEKFMHKSSGPGVLGAKIKGVYEPLFQASHAPHTEADDTLKNLFNIHSGGGEATIRFQIQTFKSLCDFASFSESGSESPQSSLKPPPESKREFGANMSGPPSVRIDLHIHLPENKTSRDYEAIIQDIARYIYLFDETTNG